MDCITNQFPDWDHSSGKSNAKPLLKTTYPFPCREPRCVICYEEWSNNDELLLHTGICGTLCHKDCLVTWLQNDCRCPWCKQCVRCGDLRHMHPVDEDDRQRVRIATRAQTFFEAFDAIRRQAAGRGHLKFLANLLDFLIIRIKKGDKLHHIMFGPAPKKIHNAAMTFVEATSILVRTGRKWPSLNVVAQILFHLEATRYTLRRIMDVHRDVKSQLTDRPEMYPPKMIEELLMEHLDNIQVPSSELIKQISRDIKLIYGDGEWDNINIMEAPPGAESDTSQGPDPHNVLIMVNRENAFRDGGPRRFP